MQQLPLSARQHPTETMQHIAVIDLGSNTSKLILLAYESGHRYKQIDELRQVVRLAEGMGQSQIIRADAFERGLDALEIFSAYCQAAGVNELCATATSAVRDAKNGEGFLAAVQARTGLELRILSGEEEAYYGSLAIANSMHLGAEDTYVLDIGGGSAQLSLLQERRFVEGESWPLGALRITETFLRSDPPKKKEIKALLAYVDDCLGDSFRGKAKGRMLVGMGGTIRNLAKIHKKHVKYPLDLLGGYQLDKDALETIVEMLCSSSIEKKRQLPGLKQDRADIIAAGALVAQRMVHYSGAQGITISSQGLREGLFYSYFLEQNPALLEDVREFSVQNLARNYYDNPSHNAHVRHLSLQLFDGLSSLHGYGQAERDMLAAAAVVHDIGMAVSYNDHHKHSFYLLMENELPGYQHREQAIIALLCYYHRKGNPSPQGLEAVLETDDMERVAKLAALLRLAEYFERSKSQRIHKVSCHLSDDYVQIEAHAEPGAEVRVEIREAKQRSGLFADAYKVDVDIVLAAH